MTSIALLLLAALPQLSPVPVDLAAVTITEADALDARPVVIPLDNLGAWDPCGAFDCYAVASDAESERGVMAPPGRGSGAGPGRSGRSG
jgi:hypothetical protein